MIKTSPAIVSLGFISGLAISTHAVGEEIAKFKDAFGTLSDLEAKSYKTGETHAHPAMTKEIVADNEGQSTEESLASVSSFPLRLVHGEAKGEHWLELPKSALAPKPLKQWYTAKNCKFALIADAFSIDVTSGDALTDATQKTLAPQTILAADSDAVDSFMVSAVLQIKVKQGSEEFCRKVFADRRVRFARATLTTTALMFKTRTDEQAQITENKAAQTELIYLSWDDKEQRLVATDRAGLPATVQSAQFDLPKIDSGVYYLNYEPSWTVERVARQLVAN